MAEHKRDVHGYTVHGEDNAVKGMDYLDYTLDYSEAKVFFDRARNAGKVDFEDRENRDYTLTHKSGRFTITRRKSSSGWF